MESEIGAVKDELLRDIQSEQSLMQSNSEVMEFEFVSLEDGLKTDVIPMRCVKEECSEDKVESDIHNKNMCLKLEPKDEINIEDHCVSSGEGVDGSLSWSTHDHGADSILYHTAHVPSFSSLYTSTVTEWCIPGSSVVANHDLEEECKRNMVTTHQYEDYHVSSNVPCKGSKNIALDQCIISRSANKLINESEHYRKPDTEHSHVDYNLKTHSAGKDKICGECGKRFTRNAHLKRHLKIHFGGKDHKCAECGKCFIEASALRNHIKSHSGEKDHKCVECGACFIYGSSLQKHLKVHSGKRDHKCEKCGKCFIFDCDLRIHLKIHASERDYKCAECGKCFTYLYNLERHLKIHSENNYKCAQCEKCFSYPCSFKNHLKSHIGEKNHKCSECGKCFTQGSNLRRHLKVHYGE